MNKDVSIVSLRERPELAEEAITYAHQNWSFLSKHYESAVRESVKAEGIFPLAYVLVKKEKMIGFFVLQETDVVEGKGLSPWITLVFVDESERGNNLIRDILLHGRRKCGELGFDKVYLCTNHIGLYEKYGFREIGLDLFEWGGPAKLYENDTIKDSGKISKKMSSTKELYLIEALRLFADKGYEAVGVVEISKAVGCTTSALYKHFAGKKALYDAILELGERSFGENMTRLKVNFLDYTHEEKENIIAMTEEEQIGMVKELFQAVAEGEYPRLFRKLMLVEQFKHPELGHLYNKRYVTTQTKSFECLMRIWMEGGVIKPLDPHILAVQYVSPIIVAISVFDREPRRKNELLQLLEAHVKQFNKVYRIS